MSGRTTINGRYELDGQPIARGGMGEVWGGRDTKLDRQVAVKFIRFPEDVPDDELVRRFVRESRITARLEHPGVPAVYDVGTHQKRPYLVMQRISGISVADLIAEQGQLPVGWAAAIAAQTCAVLSVAHEASLVHRDLKPGNLMLESDGGVKVLDFGLAVALDLTDFSKITRTGQSFGTPAYMAPEQIQAGLSGPHTDLYSLGCTLHEMLAGEQVFAGSTPYSVMNRQVDEPPRPIRELRPDVPVGLEELLLTLLHKRPEDRPDGADAVYRQLLQYVTGLGPLPGVLQPATVPSPSRMYAGVLSRVLADAAPVPPPAPPAGGAVVPVPPPASVPSAPRPRSGRMVADAAPAGRDELSRARDEAHRLMRQSRYRHAADVLSAVVDRGAQAFGDADSEVLDLRMELADVLFEGGDYRAAIPVYQQLARDLAIRRGAGAEPVLHCRFRAATCHALAGQIEEALRQLGELLTDESRVFGPDDPRTLELRRQIGLLQIGARHHRAAIETLDALLPALIRCHGPAHPTVTEARDLLENLRRRDEA
ncbi:serine/threonine-protein kinase [Polymorphospora sp. NPDC051019]|uniref:serine/threonine-protein kinase n=1 Tax=Polymorphospora sp. NPDC051019 TaxID=3155725 RepID=UPI00343D36E2